MTEVGFNDNLSGIIKTYKIMPNKFEQFDDFDLPISVGEFEDEDTREISPSDLATLKESAHMEEGSLPPNLAGDMEMEPTDILPMDELKTNASAKPAATRDAFADTVLVPGLGSKAEVLLSSPRWSKISTPPEQMPAVVKEDPTNIYKQLDFSEHMSDEEVLNTQSLFVSINDKIGDVFEEFYRGKSKKEVENKLNDEIFWAITMYIIQEKNTDNLKSLHKLMNERLSRHFEKRLNKSPELAAFHSMVFGKFKEMSVACFKRISELEPIDEKANRISDEWRARNLDGKLQNVVEVEVYPISDLKEIYEKHVVLNACILKHADQLFRFGISVEDTAGIVFATVLKTAQNIPQEDSFRAFLVNFEKESLIICERVNAKMQEERARHKQNACGMKRDSQPDSKKESVYMTGVKKIEKKQSKAKSWFSKTFAAAGLLMTLFGAGSLLKSSCEEEEETNPVALTEDIKPEDIENVKTEAKSDAEYLSVRTQESAMDLENAEEEIVVNAEEIDMESLNSFNFTEEFESRIEQNASADEASEEVIMMTEFEAQKREIKTGDTMWGFMKEWKKTMKMDNVRSPEYFDDFNDWDILTALAIFSDEEAVRQGDENYKKISGDLNLRRGRNFYFTEDAGEILFILTRPDFREKAERATGSYEGWRNPSENSGNELSSLEKAEVKNAENEDSSVNSIEIDDEWENMAKDEALIPIEIDDEWENIALDEALIPVHVDTEAENMAEDEALIPIDIDNEWEKMAQDEALIPIDIDDEWVKMLEGGAEKVVEDTKKKVENVLTFEEIDAEWDEMDEDAELEMALNAMIK